MDPIFVGGSTTNRGCNDDENDNDEFVGKFGRRGTTLLTPRRGPLILDMAMPRANAAIRRVALRSHANDDQTVAVAAAGS